VTELAVFKLENPKDARWSSGAINRRGGYDGNGHDMGSLKNAPSLQALRP